MKTKALLVLTTCFINLLNAQVVRQYSNEFLNIGVDAASLGMANAVAASTDNVNSAYWNPAGLLNIEEKQVALMHAAYFANIANYDYGAFASRLDDHSVVALSIIRFGVDDILDTRALITAGGDITPFDLLPTFSTADYAFTLSYARQPLTKSFSYGINAKVIRRIIGDFASAWGFGFDAGLKFKSKNQKWQFGLMARDITTTFNAWKIDDDIFDIETAEDNTALEQQEIPEKQEVTIPSVQAGIHRLFELKRNFHLGVEGDVNARFTQTNDVLTTSFLSLSPSLGMEFNYNNIIFLRGGVGNFQNIEQFNGSDELSYQPNFGVGFSYKGITVDYALTDIGDQSASIYSNIFSLTIDWQLFR